MTPVFISSCQSGSEQDPVRYCLESQSFLIVISAALARLFSSSIFFISAICVSIGPHHNIRNWRDSLPMQCSHRWCIFLTPPHTGHLHNDVTSLSAFPAICLCLFFECDVFFFGTALRIPSQIPSSSDGMDGRFRDIAGRAMAYFGRNGRDICLVHSDANVLEESRGRRELAARVDSIAPAMSAVFGSSDALSRTAAGVTSEWVWGERCPG